MRLRRIIIVGAAAIIAAGAMLYLVLPPSAAPPPKTSASIKSLTVEKPLLVVRGTNLGSVELWAVPTGTGVTEAAYQKLGVAALDHITASGTERWIIPIPQHPVLATEIFAKGFGNDGTLVGTASLPETGASAIHDALWGSASGTTQ